MTGESDTDFDVPDDVAPEALAAEEKRANEEGSTYCCRSLVGVAGLQEPLERSDDIAPASAFFCSGFIMSFGNRWFWVTAGHVVKRMENAKRIGYADYRDFKLVDNYGPNPTWQDGYPFLNFWGARKLVEYDENRDNSPDFALVELSHLEQQALMRNGVVPVVETDWRDMGIDDFEEFILIGLPAESVEKGKTMLQDHYVVHGKAFPNLIYVEREPDHPVPRGTQYVRLACRLGENCPQMDIEGMSGGPILGFAPGKLIDRVVAIQGSWLSRSRIIFGTPLSVVGPIAEAWVNSLE